MLTFVEMVQNADEIVTLKAGREYKINNIKEKLLELLESSYSLPSLAIGTNAPLDVLLLSNIWINIKLKENVDYMGEMCNEFLFAIKPKYDFLMIYKKLDGVICEKVPMVNLAMKTTNFLNFLSDSIQGEM